MTRGIVTDLMVLDGEENEALTVLLEKRLVHLLLLDARGDHRRFLLLRGLLSGLGLNVGCGGNVRADGLVLLVGVVEVELLDGGLHLERIESGGSLELELLVH